MSLFHDSRAALEEARDAIAEWLWGERRLRLKRPGAEPRRTRGRFTSLGYRVSRGGIRPTRALVERMERRIRELVLRGDVERIERSLASYQGIVTFAG